MKASQDLARRRTDLRNHQERFGLIQKQLLLGARSALQAQAQRVAKAIGSALWALQELAEVQRERVLFHSCYTRALRRIALAERLARADGAHGTIVSMRNAQSLLFPLAWNWASAT